MEIIGLIVAILALVVSVCGIYDVRHKVRLLLSVERNRAYTKAVNEAVLSFVEPIDEPSLRWASVHEFAMLQNALDAKRTTENSQAVVINDALQTAAKLVKDEMARWKPGMSPEVASELVKEWQTAKNTALLNSIFSRRQGK